MDKKIITKVVFILLGIAGTCWAGCCAKNAASKKDSLEVNLVETTLDQLKEKTGQLQSYQCELEYLFSQPLLESATLRKGVLYYKKSDGRSELRINFETLKQDDEQEQKYVEHYIFDGVWLTVIDYQIKQVKRYQQSEPNEPIDAFELAGRNFPLIGFSSAGELRKEFEIELAEQEGSKEENFIKLGLKVKPDSIYKDDYSKVEFWIDRELGLPARIVAVSTEEDIYDIKFLKVKVNEKINEKVFEFKIPKGFGEPEIIPLKKRTKEK